MKNITKLTLVIVLFHVQNLNLISQNIVMKDLIKKNYHYKSEINQTEFIIGESITVSNKITKSTYNVAGKPVLVKFIKQNEIQLNNKWNPFSKKEIDLNDSSPFLLDRKTIYSNLIKSQFESKIIFSNKTVSDYLGEANFSFILSNEGMYNLVVFFLNSQDLYTEHVNFIPFKVINPNNINYYFLLPFLMLSVTSLIVAFRFFIFKKKRHWSDRFYYPILMITNKISKKKSIKFNTLFSFSLLHLLILILLAWCLKSFPNLFIIILVGLILSKISYLNLISLEILFIWMFNYFLIDYGGIERLIDLLDKKYFLLISIISLLFPSYPVFGGLLFLSWLYSPIIYDQLIYFFISSFLCYLFYLYLYKKNFLLVK